MIIQLLKRLYIIYYEILFNKKIWAWEQCTYQNAFIDLVYGSLSLG